MIDPDADHHDPDDRPWRPAASGPSFVYVFPRPGEDLLKLGMSRDPLARMQSLHPRWYEFFDLDAGWILATDRVREARAIELRLARALAGHRAPAPLTVAHAAGGSTEWYRGAANRLESEADSLVCLGYMVQRPLRRWLMPAVREQAPLLFDWSEKLLDELEATGPAGPALSSLEWRMRNALDALPALGIELQDALPARVLAWHAESTGRIGSYAG